MGSVDPAFRRLCEALLGFEPHACRCRPASFCVHSGDGHGINLSQVEADRVPGCPWCQTLSPHVCKGLAQEYEGGGIERMRADVAPEETVRHVVKAVESPGVSESLRRRSADR